MDTYASKTTLKTDVQKSAQFFFLCWFLRFFWYLIGLHCPYVVNGTTLLPAYYLVDGCYDVVTVITVALPCGAMMADNECCYYHYCRAPCC